jgi:hypothetical protein
MIKGCINELGAHAARRREMTKRHDCDQPMCVSRQKSTGADDIGQCKSEDIRAALAIARQRGSVIITLEHKQRSACRA